MAQVKFTSTGSTNKTTDTNKLSPKELNFTLEPGRTAYVRFLHHTPEEFDLETVHLVPVPGTKFGKEVACLRESHEPMENCPLCSAGYQVKTKIFVHMIQYTMMPDGSIKAEPKIFERPLSFGKDIANKMNLYSQKGDFTKLLFGISRIGSGINDTKYSIDFVEPLPQNYPLADDAWENVGYSHLYVMKKTSDEMVHFIEHGDFPVRENQINRQNVVPQTQIKSDPLPQTFTPAAYQTQELDAPIPGATFTPVQQTVTSVTPPTRRYYE